jgi:hypothetical protein
MSNILIDNKNIVYIQEKKNRIVKDNGKDYIILFIKPLQVNTSTYSYTSSKVYRKINAVDKYYFLNMNEMQNTQG